MDASAKYYVKNGETGKLNIYSSKEFYAALQQEEKKVFTSFCLFSRSQGCWMSKGKAENCHYLVTQLNAMGFEYKGTIGERLSFEEQVKQTKERAEVRAERADARSEKASQRSDEFYAQAKDMASVIPFGQPILVGHHSEQRDRNYRNKIHNKFGKAFAEQDKADYYAQKAENARWTAKGAQYDNPLYLTKRIKECQKHLRTLAHRLEGKFYAHSEPRPISDQERIFYEGRTAEEKDKLGFFIKCMKELNPAFDPESLQPKRGKYKGKSM